MNDVLDYLLSPYTRYKRDVQKQNLDNEQTRLENEAKTRTNTPVQETIKKLLGTDQPGATPQAPSGMAADAKNATSAIFGRTAGVPDQATQEPVVSATPAPQPVAAPSAPDPRQQLLDKAKTMGFAEGDLPFTMDENVKRALIGLRDAQSSKSLRDTTKPLDKLLKEVLPGITPEEVTKQFGEGATLDTPFSVAQRLSLLNIKRDGSNKLFPVSSLSPLAQEAARNGGLGQFVTESQARILNAGNLPNPATAEEIKDSADMGTIRSEIAQIRNLAQRTNYKGIGLATHFINNLGQYSPISELKTDPDVVQLYQLLNDVNNKMIYLQSGKQINESEFKRLKSVFPDPSTNETTFITRLNSFDKNFEDLAANRTKTAQKANRRLPSQGGAPTNPAATTGTGMSGKTSRGTAYEVLPD